MDTKEQKTERARLLAEYAARGGVVTVCGADRRGRTSVRPLRYSECQAPGVKLAAKPPLRRRAGEVRDDTPTYAVTCHDGTRVFRLIVVPRTYATVMRQLGKSAARCQREFGYSRDCFARTRARELYTPEHDGVDAFTASDNRPSLFASVLDARHDDAWGRS